MAELFELSAMLRMDISGFEQDVRRAMTLASGLEQRLAALSEASASAMNSVRRATASVNVGPNAAASGSELQGSQAGGAAEMAAVVAGALRSVTVQMDGKTVGRLVAATVDEQIGRTARERRYTG